jgi:hypothetical protein
MPVITEYADDAIHTIGEKARSLLYGFWEQDRRAARIENCLDFSLSGMERLASMKDIPETSGNEVIDLYTIAEEAINLAKDHNDLSVLRRVRGLRGYKKRFDVMGQAFFPLDSDE